jgi:hypothetical protein
MKFNILIPCSIEQIRGYGVHLGGVLGSTEGRSIKCHGGDDGWLHKNPSKRLNGKNNKNVITLYVDNVLKNVDFAGVMSKAA